MQAGATASSALSPWRATSAALCANLVGIGLARFAYTPLIPALIAAGWFSPSAAVYLGAANLAGYLAGALGARRIATCAGTAATLRAAMILTAVSLFACAHPSGFLWFFVWRFLSGGTGGVLMVLAAPCVMPGIPVSRRGLAGGAIFTGVGLGIAASGTLVPLLMRWGLVETWLGLGFACLVLAAFAWTAWPPEQKAVAAPAPSSRGRAAASPELRALYVEYALNAVGLVPHMVFLVDYIARGLGRGLPVGARYWVVFGIGALIGPLIGGHAGDRIGFRAILRIMVTLQALAVALLLLPVSSLSLGLSSFIVGASVPGIVAITHGRVRELVPGDPSGQAAAWSWCTIAFAIGQAIAGYGFSYIFASVANGYSVLFALAAVALMAVLILDLAVPVSTLRRGSRE
ncbi:MAG TPA: YbfB/YjiJ family MFS transporter [Stellaceae bacterium]|jgi:predicted MFS family arabinose efflux permease|nr:YbfB/YjiJ family MFS transporter [Stellaceae bacterium]